ncbi:MAG: type II toxin-antitoxin system RelE/ParE family toxin [Peptococcaceae bacterium]|nr:type II toxin-antitoxin system RelE/ParE family toxin [Peptococcaceae bacterium]
MATYKVDLLPIVRWDIADIYCNIALNNQQEALEVTNEIMDKIETLVQFPDRCPLAPDGVLARQGYRMQSIGDYVVFYKVFDAKVVVYRILYGKRDYEQVLNSTSIRSLVNLLDFLNQR